MKLNKLMITSIVLLVIFSLSAVVAADSSDDITYEVLGDDVELSQIAEDTLSDDLLSDADNQDVLGDEEIVTSQNLFNYFDDEGTLLDSVTSNSLKFKGNFSNTFQYITIQRPIEITGEDATFNNVGFKITSDDVKLSNLKFIASNSYPEGLINIDGANDIVLSGLDINYCVGDVEAIGINVMSQNTIITNNNIHFESHVVSDEELATALNFKNSQELIVEYNNITCMLPALQGVYDESTEFMGLNKVNPIRIDEVNSLKLRYNKIVSNTNAILDTFPTIQSILIINTENSIIDNNNISMSDVLTPDGNSSFLYGISFSKVNNVTISNCDFLMSTTGGKNEEGTAYAIQGIQSDIKIIGNKINSVSKGPMIGIYIASLGGENSEIDIRDNFINVTGRASNTGSWALVTGIEIQNGNAKIINNTIYTYSITPYDDNNFHFGISYAQWMYGERSFDIRNNTIYSGGKYTISTIATKVDEDEHTDLTAINNYLIAHDLKGDDSIYSLGAVIVNNTPRSGENDSSQNNGSEIENNSSKSDSINITANNIWIGQDNTVSVIVPDGTGKITLKINDNSYEVDLINGIAAKTLLSSELNPGENIITVKYNDITQNAKFYVLNGVVTQDNVLAYFDQSNNGALCDCVPAGVTLDFRGEIKASQIGDFDICINKPVNIISSTNNAYIDLNSIATSRDGKSPGNRFIINKLSSNTNITGISFHNSQIWLSNTDHVILDNINVTVENQNVGWGVGVVSIRDNSSYVTVKNSYFSTLNNGGSSTLVLGWVNYCTVENNIIRGEGNVGNIFYLNTYNVDVPSGAMVNSYNTIKGNKIYGPTSPSSICRAVCYMGTNNLFENNEIYYSGEGLVPSDNGDVFANNIVKNNKFFNGASASLSKGVIFFNNDISGKVTAYENVVMHNNTCSNLIFAGDNVLAYNNTVNGIITIKAIQGSQIKDSIINGDITFEKNSFNVTLSNNVIKGTITIVGYGNNILNNNITSTGDYAIVCTNSQAKDNVITKNRIYSASKSGDDAVNDKYKKNHVETNLPVSDINVILEDITVGQDEVVEIYAPQDITGAIKIKFNDLETAVTMDNGYGSKILSNLAAGNYTVEVTFDGDGKYGAKTIKKTFSVIKNSVSLKNAVNVVVLDNVPHVSVDLGSDVSGELTVKVNSKEFSESITSGKSTVVVSGLDSGTYTATVTYSGDLKYKSDSTTVDFKIKGDAGISVSPEDIYVGNDELITINMDKSISGSVIVTVNDVNTVQINQGIGKLTISGLGFGNYTVNVKFDGNDDFLPFEVNKSFKVVKNDISPDRLIMNCDGKSVEFTLDLSDASGELELTIAGDKYVNSTSDGIKLQLAPGKYSATLTYSGDDKYNFISKDFTFEIDKYETDLTAVSSDIVVGENLTITVSINKEITDGVAVIIDNNPYQVTLSEGRGNVVISNLNVGNYTAVVKFVGNKNFTDKEIHISFTVSKIKLPDDLISVNQSIFRIDLPNDASGKLIVTVGKEYDEPVINGTAIVEVNDLDPGDYDVLIVYSGDEKYEGFSKNAKLNVPKISSSVSLAADNIRVGDSAVFNIKVEKDAVGEVKLIIGNAQYNESVVNGTAIIKVDNLSYGNYTVVVRYLGDDKYLESENRTNLTVSKVPLSKDYFVHDGNRIIINLPEDVREDVIITKNNLNSTLPLNNGHEVYSLVDPGEYNVTVTYPGDAKYEMISADFKVNINKLSSFIKVDVCDIYVGDAARFNITVPEQATGLVFVIIENNKYNGTLSNGKVTVDVSGLSNGTYDVVVKYEGDENYYGNDNRTALNVLKRVVENVDSVITIPASDSTASPSYSINLEGATGNLTVFVDDVEYDTVSLVNGAANIDVKNLPSGNHDISIVYSGDEKYSKIVKNTTLSVPEPPAPHIPVINIIGNDVSMLYTSGAKYQIRLTRDGSAFANQIITFTVNGVKSTAITDSDGIAFVVLNLAPKSTNYDLTAEFNGVKTNNNVKVNSILSAKNIKVKKSAKSLKIKVTIKKVNGNYVKSKKLTLKLNGKKYTAKSNKKGVVTFKIPKKAIKKLKAGKKYSYNVVYLKDSIKKTISVKK